MSAAHDSEQSLRAFAAPRYWPGWLAMALLRAVIVLPHGWLCRLGRGLGVALYHLHRRRRAVCRANIDACFPELGVAAREALVRDSFRHTGITVFETPLAWWGNEQWLRAHCEVEGLEHLQRALQHGKGVILLTGHSTSLEMGARLLSLQLPLQVMYRTVRNKLVNAIALRARNRHFARVILRTRLRETLRGLAENLPTWYAPDQDFGSRGTVFATFFGIPAATLTAPARLARISGAAVVPFFQYRLAGGGYRLVIQPPVDDFPGDDELRDAQRLNDILQAQVTREPAQYLWVHQRFKTRPPGETSMYR